MLRATLVPWISATLALCAWLHARGVSALLGADLAVPRLPALSAPPAAPDPPRERSADPILARNPFDSVTGPLGRPRVPPTDGPEDEAASPCEGVRVASIVASAGPAGSLVMLEVPGQRGPILRREGSEVVAIATDRVLLQRDGRRCVARIFAPGGTPTTAASTPPPVEAARGIARTGPGSFALDRGARDALIDGAGDLMRSVAVRPEKQGDDVIGLRITTLRPGTPLDALGVRAGDVLLSVDGIPLTAPDRMLEAYARMRTEERCRVVVQRDGKPLQLDYQVR